MDFIYLLVAHWVGDYLLQSTNMAVKKSSNIKWLLLHIGTYTLVLLVIGNFVFSWQIALGYAVINGGLHLVIDFITSKVAKQFQGNPRIYFPILGFDQLIHIVCLYWTYINSDILAL